MQLLLERVREVAGRTRRPAKYKDDVADFESGLFQDECHPMYSMTLYKLVMARKIHHVIITRKFHLKNILNMFLLGNAVLQIIFCHHGIETQEINICVCMCIHDFKQNTR